MLRDHKEYIDIKSCKHGYTYKILARNGYVGIFDSSDNSFTLSRIKFKLNFLDKEDHWDTGEPHGTVKPLEEIEKCQENLSDAEKLSYLNSISKIYEESVRKAFRKSI
jgi:hypothetical protein